MSTSHAAKVLATTEAASGCVLCGSLLSGPARVIGELRLARCADCSLIRLEVSENLQDYVARMEADFFGDGNLAKRDRLDQWLRLRQARRRLRAVRRYKTGGDLLEVGSGTGESLFVAGTMGFRSAGVELSPPAAEYARRRYRAQVYCQPVETIRFDRPFDVVMMGHVLEHLPDPVGALRDLRRALKADGVLYIAVPNADSWEARWAGWTSYEPYHLFYFSPRTLRRTLEAAGYEVLSLSTRDPFSGWFNTLLRTALKSRYASARARFSRPQEAVSFQKKITLSILHVARFISGGFTVPLRWVQSRLGRGEELIAIARSRR